jgi:hypothetical protein
VSISPEAWAQSSVSGLGTSAEAGTTSSAAYAPGARKAITSAPASIGPAGPAASGPTAVTTPEASEPSRSGSCVGSVPKAPL